MRDGLTALKETRKDVQQRPADVADMDRHLRRQFRSAGLAAEKATGDRRRRGGPGRPGNRRGGNPTALAWR